MSDGFPEFLTHLSPTDDIFAVARWTTGRGSLDRAFEWLDYAVSLVASADAHEISPFIVVAQDLSATRGCKSYTVVHRMHPALLNPPPKHSHLYAVTSTDSSPVWPFFDFDFSVPMPESAIVAHVQRLSAALFRKLFFMIKTRSAVPFHRFDGGTQTVDIYVSDGNDEKPANTSFHVHIGPCTVPLFILAEAVQELIRDASVDTTGVDACVYSARHCFRLPFSSKKAPLDVTTRFPPRVLRPMLRMDTFVPSRDTAVYPDAVAWSLQSDWSSVANAAVDRAIICPYVTLLVRHNKQEMTRRSIVQKRLRDVAQRVEVVSDHMKATYEHLLRTTMSDVFACMRNMLWYSPLTAKYMSQTFPGGVSDLDIRVRLSPNGASVDVLNCRFCVISQREHSRIHMKFVANRHGLFFHCWHPDCQSNNAVAPVDTLLDTRRWPLIRDDAPAHLTAHIPDDRRPIPFQAPHNSRLGFHVPYLHDKVRQYRPRFVNLEPHVPSALTYSGPVGKFYQPGTHPHSEYHTLLDPQSLERPPRTHDMLRSD